MTKRSDGQSAGLDICLLVGDRGSGKSGLCLDLLRELRTAGRAGGGIICPGLFNRNLEKYGCLALDCRAFVPETWRDYWPIKPGQAWMAEIHDRDGLRLLGSNLAELDGPRWRRWSFRAATFDWADRLVSASLRRPDELTIIDEIGPVETELDAGFAAAWQGLLELRRELETSIRTVRLSADRQEPRRSPLLPLLFPLPEPDLLASSKQVLVTVRPELAAVLETWLRTGVKPSSDVK